MAYRIETVNFSIDLPSTTKAELSLKQAVSKQEGIAQKLPLSLQTIADLTPTLTLSFMIVDSNTAQVIQDKNGNIITNVTMQDFWNIYADRQYSMKVYVENLSYQNPITNQASNVDYFVCNLVQVNLIPSRTRIVDNSVGKVITATMTFLLGGE